MNRQRPLAAGFVAFVLWACWARIDAMPDLMNEIYRKLPDAISGWQKSALPARYTPENLSSYIDGGAELFLSYNFRSALSLRYRDAAGGEIEIDVFDMASSPDAFGVFAHSRETIDERVGQGCEYAAGLLTFWKDRFYVSILAYPETDKKREVVFELGRAIAKAIPNPGAPPPVIALLPAENLLPETVRYFHHHVWLNSFLFVANENVLNIGGDTPAALGKYKQDGAVYFLLLVRYPDAAKAEAASGQFRDKILGGAGMRPDKDGRWTGLQCQGDLVRIVFNAPDAAAIQAVFSKIEK